MWQTALLEFTGSCRAHSLVNMARVIPGRPGSLGLDNLLVRPETMFLRIDLSQDLKQELGS